MIEHTLDKADSILYVRPKSKLEEGDFVQLAKTVDPHIERGETSPVSSSRSPPFLDGRALGQWRAIFALCGITTSTSFRSAS